MPHPSSSIFLKEGAFVRWADRVYVYQGPFLESLDVKKQPWDLGIQHFFDRGLRPVVAKARLVLHPEEFEGFLSERFGEQSVSWDWQLPEFSEYQSTFHNHLRLMEEEKLTKTVPFVFAKIARSLSEHQKQILIKRVSSFGSPLIPFGYWNSKEGVVGVTPEILFEVKDGTATSMALAGTIRDSENEDLLISDKKLIDEHEIVVRELEEKWSYFGHVEKGPRAVMNFPGLKHLCTPFVTRLQEPEKVFELVQALHPTSAVGMAPSQKWRKLESVPKQKERTFYGSPLMFRLNQGHFLCLVGLRMVQWDQNCIRIPAGGGIVKQSSVEKEWDEVQAKLESVRKLLGV